MQVIDKANPFPAKIKERYPLTKPGSSKETYHIVLDIKDSEMVFKPGDSIGVLAENDPVLVEHILDAVQAEGSEQIVEPRSGQTYSIRSFLKSKANLSRLTSSFLKLFYDFEENHDEKNHLHRFLQPENKALLTQYLSTHDTLDLIKTYKDTKVPLQALCEKFGPLLPRFYSLASSLSAYPEEAHLTVAISTFTHAGEKRFGVASHFLCHLAELQKTQVPIYVQTAHAFALPSNNEADLIMIGSGTGVAPYRAFLQERLAQKASGAHWLFFGERSRVTDFLYQDEWNALVEQGKLRLDTAFSRDQEEKIYVQHRLYENAAEIWNWLEAGAYIYLCGDAHNMAKDVEAMLIKIFEEQGGMDTPSAKVHLKYLRTSKRFLLDVY